VKAKCENFTHDRAIKDLCKIHLEMARINAQKRSTKAPNQTKIEVYLCLFISMLRHLSSVFAWDFCASMLL